MAITANDIKKLSPQAKALIVIVVILVIGYLYYFYFLSDLIAKKATLEKENQDIQVQIKQKEKVALELNKYKGEVDTLTDSYKLALLKLPDQREIPGLFHSVSLAGKDAGIEFLLFEPKPAVPKGMPDAGKPKVSAMMKPSDQRQQGPQKADAQKPDDKSKPGDGKKAPEPEPFYEEIPVKVTVTGSFQNTVHFFEKVAKLPRIVNISDISMGDRKNVKGRGDIITTSCTVKTYMFVDKKEQTSEKKNEKN
ncbi:MAG: type 4a pilus biogenesis protein PilO [Smithellaceae bacterium]|nr:type 4a pilus biogenesis protein PilO [Smithellaceae bacterium]